MFLGNFKVGKYLERGKEDFGKIWVRRRKLGLLEFSDEAMKIPVVGGGELWRLLGGFDVLGLFILLLERSQRMRKLEREKFLEN